MSPIEGSPTACGHVVMPPAGCELTGGHRITRLCRCGAQLWWSVDRDRWMAVADPPAAEVGARSPDLSRKVLGYRVFMLSTQGELVSIVTRNVWMPGPNHARCDQAELMRDGGYNFGALLHPPPEDPHPAPDAGCVCGLYAWHSIPAPWLIGELKSPGTIGAAVVAWGRLEVHREGFRAEWAEIVALVHDPYDGPVRREEARRAADLYGVRLVPVTELDGDEEIQKLGERVPDQLLPEPESPRFWLALPPGYPAGPGPYPGTGGSVARSGSAGLFQHMIRPISPIQGLIVPPPVTRVTGVGVGAPHFPPRITPPTDPPAARTDEDRRRALLAPHAALALNAGFAGWNAYNLATENGHLEVLSLAALLVNLICVAVCIRLRRSVCRHYEQD